MSADPKGVFQNHPQLTRAQREAIRGALLSARKGDSVSATQRRIIRDIAHVTADGLHQPERSLVAFKSLINDAANDLGIPLGRERANVLDRFVTLFIEEMYGAEAAAPGQDGDCRGKSTGFIPAGSRELPGARL